MELQIDNLGKVSITVEKDYWNINKCYDKLVAVEREGYGAYLSRKPVPEGIYIDNREYWIRLGFPGSSGSVNLVQTFGYDAGVAISQKAITEKFDEIEAILNDIISGGVITTVTFNPPSISVNESTDIIIGVEVNIEADKISIFRGNVKIGEDGSGTVYSVSDTITPSNDFPIIYRVKVEKNGKIVSNVTATLPIDKADGLVKWMRGGNEVTKDTVTALETGHTYPTLYNPDELTPISYTSSNPSVARVTKLNDYSYKIDIVSFGSTDIHAIFSGNAIYNAIDLAYNLVVSKAKYEDFKWVDPRTEKSIMDDPVWEINKSNLPNVIYPVLKRTVDKGTVTYSTSPEQSNIASINSVTGNIILGTALGTVVINAQFSGDNIYEAKTVSYSLIVQQQVQPEFYWAKVDEYGTFTPLTGEVSYSLPNYDKTLIKLITNIGEEPQFTYKMAMSGNYAEVYDANHYNKVHDDRKPAEENMFNVERNGDDWRLLLTDRLMYVNSNSEQYQIVATAGGYTSDVKLKPYKATRQFAWQYSPWPTNSTFKITLPEVVGDEGYDITSMLPTLSHMEEFYAPGMSNVGVWGNPASPSAQKYAELIEFRDENDVLTGFKIVAYRTTIGLAERQEYDVHTGQYVVIPADCVKVRAITYDNGQYQEKVRVYNLQILPPATPDYYVGWTNTANYDAYESMTPANVAALTLDEGHAGQTYERAYGSDNTFFLLYNGGTVPPVVKLVSQNKDQEINLVSDNMWVDGNEDYKGDVTIGGTTFKVYSRRSPRGYDSTDKMRITLQGVIL